MRPTTWRTPVFGNGSAGTLTERRCPTSTHLSFRPSLFSCRRSNDQRSVARLLGTFDEKIDANRRMNRTLDDIARATFKSWFVDLEPVRAKIDGRQTGLPPHLDALFPESFEDSDLGDTPVGWRVAPIGEVVSVVGGSTPSTKVPEFWDGSHAFATPKDLSRLSSPILLDTARRITDGGLGKIASGSPSFRCGTDVVTCSRSQARLCAARADPVQPITGGPRVPECGEDRGGGACGAGRARLTTMGNAG